MDPKPDLRHSKLTVCVTICIPRLSYKSHMATLKKNRGKIVQFIKMDRDSNSTGVLIPPVKSKIYCEASRLCQTK